MSQLVLNSNLIKSTSARRSNILSAIITKELREMYRDRRLVALSLFIVILSLAAILFGFTENSRLARERVAAAKADQLLWTGQGAKNPHAAAHFGQYAFKPVSPLSFIDPGVNPYVGTSVWLEAHKQNETQFRSARDKGLAGRLGGLSAAYILQTIAPLLILLVSFMSFTGERENGTLRQLLSLGVKPAELLIGKALSFIILILFLISPLVAFSAIAIASFNNTINFSLSDQLLRLVIMALGYCLYLTGFAFLGLGFSAISKNSRAALISLLAFWLINSFLAPRLITDIARSYAPTPTALEFRSAIAQDKAKTFGHDETHPAFVLFRNEILKKYNVARIEDLPVNFRGLQLHKDDEAGYQIFDKHFSALQASFNRQDWLRTAPGFLLPILAITPFSMAFAGTDSLAQYDFTLTAEAHRRNIQNEVSDNIINFAHNDSYVSGPELWKRIASFSYRSPSIYFALDHSLEAIFMLLSWVAVTIIFALLSVRNLRPI